jgi:hypothetical protein
MPRAYFLSTYIFCGGMYVILVFMNRYDMMGITMGLQASPLSMESGSGNELARGVCGCGIKYSDVRYLSHFSHTLVRCGMPVAVQFFEVGEVMTKEGMMRERRGKTKYSRNSVRVHGTPFRIGHCTFAHLMSCLTSCLVSVFPRP